MAVTRNIPMNPTLHIDSASSWLWWSNFAYVAGALFTFLAMMIVFIEKRLIATGKRERAALFTEYIAVGAAVLSFFGTCGAIYFSNVVSHLKDVELKAYEKGADERIAIAHNNAGDAYKAAGLANQKAANAELQNTQLKIALATHETSEKKAEENLAAQNKATSDFAHGLAQQQEIMAEQAKVSPQLSPGQVEIFAKMLMPFAGQDVEIHTTADTVVERLASEIATSLNHAGVTTKSISTDMGALYQGVSVAINDPHDVPPIANALVADLRQFGIDVHPVAVPQRVKIGQVAIFLGPN